MFFGGTKNYNNILYFKIIPSHIGVIQFIFNLCCALFAADYCCSGGDVEEGEGAGRGS